jgi:hypothetical protein
MNTEILAVIPVLPSADIARDVDWYQKMAGFQTYFADNMYAIIYRDNIILHLQWHADTDDDPLLGGSMIRILVKNIKPLFGELVERGTVTPDKFRANTPWNTNEFGFYDLNRNAVFVVEEAGREW